MNLSIFTALTILLTTANVHASNEQITFLEAKQAFQSAKAPDAKVLSKNLSTIAFAVYGDASNSEFTENVMEQKLNLKLVTDSIGNTSAFDLGVTYHINNSGDRNLELFFDKSGLKGEVLKESNGMLLYIYEECRQLRNKNIICNIKMELDENSIDLIRIYKYN